MGLFDPFNRERNFFLKDNKIKYFYKISAQPNTKKKKKKTLHWNLPQLKTSLLQKYCEDLLCLRRLSQWNIARVAIQNYFNMVLFISLGKCNFGSVWESCLKNSIFKNSDFKMSDLESRF
jgi:hypothetical protein